MTQATNFGVPTTGPASPDAMAARIQNNFEAALTGHSGPSRPSYAEAGTIWQDISTSGLARFFFYDGADDILLSEVDLTYNRVELSPQPVVEAASASTMDLGAIKSQNVRVTGGISPASLGNARKGTFRRLFFVEELTLTHDEAWLILPNNADIITSAGDVASLVSDGSGKWICVGYFWANLSAAKASINLGNLTPSTSGAAIDFTGIPTGVKRVNIFFVGVSTSGVSPPMIQIGDSGGIEASGYSGAYMNVSTTAAAANSSPASGLALATPAASSAAFRGKITLDLMDESANLWVLTGSLADSVGTRCHTASGAKALSGQLDRVRITTIGGADNFDAGSLNISWEF